MSLDIHRTHEITVLLIDDQLMIGEAVRRMLVDIPDIKYHYLRDPTKAFEVVEKLRPTVILQDLVMPDVNGMDLVRQFRAREETREIPLIVLSVKEDAKVKAEGFEAGANDYLVKLPDRIELVARIRYHSWGYINLLERNEAYEQLRATLKDLEVRNQFIRKTFGRYLTDEIVEELLESPDGLKVGGERREVTIVMTDLRGFSALSEQLEAEHVVSLLNVYLGAMIEVILKHEGTIDKFIGDAILIVFGAPIPKKDHAERAVACALEMQLAMERVNQKNRAAGYPNVEMGIGINTGEVVVGNIGSEKRTEYGVIGRDVNLASRIETYTVGGQVLISPQTYAKTSDLIRVRREMVVAPKGVKDPITIYDVSEIKGSYNLALKDDAEGLRPLETPLKVRYIPLDGKSADQGAVEGSISQISPQIVRLCAAAPLAVLDNVRIELAEPAEPELEGLHIYGKVTESFPDAPLEFLIRFTAVPPEITAYIERRIDGG